MILIHSLFTSDELSSLLTQDEVIRAKQRIDGQLSGSVYFSLELPVELHSKLSNVLGRELSVKRIPMRWIKGDTAPHVDIGSQSFEQTYLAYLTSSSGSLVFGDETYPITQGTVYSFQQGCVHGTVGTGLEPRLLLGPMSEQGFAVGASPSLIFPGGTTMYLRQIEGYTAFSTDQQDWYTFSWPATVSNSDTSLGFVTVEWTTDMTIDSTNMYFICGSSHIQFGSKSLRDDGTRPVITVTATDYTGLIQNGMGPQQGTPGLNPSQLNGYSNIRVYNLFIDGTEGSLKAGETFDEGAGWFTHNYFGKGAQRNIIINCCSAGSIPNFCGGIVGRNSGEAGDDESQAELRILGCSSTGSIADQAGGIAGAYVGYNTNYTNLSECYATGAIIGDGAGGIVGGNMVGAAIQDCYSTGQISGNNAGGIIGANGGRNDAYIENCYSTGNISGSNAGGLCGSIVTANNTNVYVGITNGYTTGNVTGPQSGGIIGLLLESGGSINKDIARVYTTGMVSGGTGYIYGNSTSIDELQYSEAGSGGSPGSWNTVNANTVLNSIPDSEPGVGETWISTGVQQPYELRRMGYTPYSAQNIRDSAIDIPILNRVYPYNPIQTGAEPFKDMDDNDYTDDFDPYDYQNTFFSDMSDFIDENIVAGDKSEENRLIASYWNDLGNDIFDGWGYFYLYDIPTGRYYFPLISPQNQDDGVITTQTFLAFGRTFTLRHGWAAQGIFMMDWSVADSLPFRFGAYGNMGSDGNEEAEYRTQAYTMGGSPQTLYYHRHSQSGSTSEILYSYFIPKEPTEATSTPYSVVYDGTDMSMRTNALTVGVTIYFSKTNNVKNWVISEITSSPIVPVTVSVPAGGSMLAALIPNRNYQLLMVEGGDAASRATFTINPTTGVISTTSATVPGTYTLYLRNTGSYYITQFDLNVIQGASVAVSTGCCDRVLDVKGLDYRTQAEVISGNIILSRFSERRGPLSSLDIIRMKQAMAQKR
jgi:hypothetical protein